MEWTDRNVLVTGGASFIGSHLVDTLVAQGAVITIVDDLSSGTLANLSQYQLEQFWGKSMYTSSDPNCSVALVVGDVRDPAVATAVTRKIETIFHLAAAHGSRGYIQAHPAQCCNNMALDQTIMAAALANDVERVVYASSACVYPQQLQATAGGAYLLQETDVSPWKLHQGLPDLEYGWSKLMGEMTMQAYARQYGMKTGCGRIFTTYGPRENATHAIVALMLKALQRLDPYPIWGDGRQDRNFTNVADIVAGLIAIADHVTDGSAINLGRSDRLTIQETAALIFDIVGWEPREIRYELDKPVGVVSQAAALETAAHVLNWAPTVDYRTGFTTTLEWLATAPFGATPDLATLL